MVGEPTNERSERNATRRAAISLSAAEPMRLSLPVGSAAVIAAICSVLICYSGVIGVAVFGIDGLVFNKHFQAVLMWALASAALWFLYRDRRRHHADVPLALGVVAVATLIGTLYLSYSPQVEAAAYVLLVIATFLNENMLLWAMHTTVHNQSTEIAKLNAQLSEKVASQEQQIGRLGRLRHFLPPQIADLVVGDDRQELLRSHRRYISCLFCDLRNFTQLSEAAEPEEVIAVLERFHDRAGARIAARGGTIGFRAGDGLMAFFNDPLEVPEPTLDALRTAWEIREAFSGIRESLSRLGYDVGLGIGIASGFATMGLIGLQGRTDYTAIGNAVNAAARLCDAAEDGQILLGKRALLDVEGRVEFDAVAPMDLKGFAKPVEVVSIRSVVGTEV